MKSTARVALSASSGAAEHARRSRHAAHHEPVPRHEQLLVAAGPNALLARREELAARRVDGCGGLGWVEAEGRGGRLGRLGKVKMPVLAFEVRRLRQPEHALRERARLRAEHAVELGRRPNVELAFLVLRIGVERRVVAAARVLHVAHDPVGRRARHARVARRARRGIRVGVDGEQLGVVVEHLLEVRDRPEPVDAVAEEAAAQVIVEAALRHAVERMRDHRERLRVRIAGAVRVPVREQELERRRVRELRPAAEAAVLGVVALLQALACRDERRARQRREVVGIAGRHAAERVDEACAALADLVAFVAVVLVDGDEHLAKRRHAVAAFLREIRAREDRQLIGRQEHGERPAAGLARQELMARLIDLVEVGALLAVDLDVDEELVHEARGLFVLERLVRHDVAPVARRIADRQQDRLAARARRGERFFVPRLASARDCPRAASGRGSSLRSSDCACAHYRASQAVSARESPLGRVGARLH